MDASSTTPAATPDKDDPGKYIRTFAGDIETVKKGGTPDLIPLDAEALQKPVVVTANLMPKPAPVVAPAPPPGISKLSEMEPKNPPLETYSADFSDRMKSMNASTATVLAAEQDRAEGVVKAKPQEPSRFNLTYSIAGGVLLIVAIAGGYIAYTRYIAASTPVAPAPVVPAPIFVDEREEISGVGPTLLQAITASVNRPLPVGTVRLLYVASSTGTVNVFSALPVSIPDMLMRNMSAVGSMAGVVNVGGNQNPFFILPVLSYSPVFFGMLQWEPLMPGHLAELFPPYPVAIPETITATTTAATTTSKSLARAATTTPSASALIRAPSVAFVDATIANHDVRVYRDAAGRDVFLYGFWNQSTLIIARDAAAFTEIVNRLATARAQ